MPFKPEDSLTVIDTVPITGDTFAENILSTFGGGAIAALAGGFLGSIAFVIGEKHSDWCALLMATLATASVGVLFPRGTTECLRPWKYTLVWFVLAFVLTITLDRLIPPGAELPRLRWAISATIVAVFLFPLKTPIWLARGGKRFDIGNAAMVGDIAFLIARVLRLASAGRIGFAAAGALGGAIGAVPPGLLLSEVGDPETTLFFGGYWRIPLGMILIGFSGGGIGAWSAWNAAVERSRIPSPVEDLGPSQIDD